MYASPHHARRITSYVRGVESHAALAQEGVCVLAFKAVLSAFPAESWRCGTKAIEGVGKAKCPEQATVVVDGTGKVCLIHLLTGIIAKISHRYWILCGMKATWERGQ